MHLAICDDNTADRKQAERLVGREADKWIAKGDPIYSFSFGSAASLLASAITYDAVLIDISNTEGRNTLEVIQKFKEKGIRSAIIVCDPKIDENTEGLPDDVLFLPKPIKVADLHETFEKVADIISHYENKIELREDKATRYISEKDFEYAKPVGSGSTVVHLINGEIIHVNVNTENLFLDIEASHPTFIMAKGFVIVNVRYVETFKFRKVITKSGNVFKLTKVAMKYARNVFAEMIE